jgi:hypothetical protein
MIGGISKTRTSLRWRLNSPKEVAARAGRFLMCSTPQALLVTKTHKAPLVSIVIFPAGFQQLLHQKIDTKFSTHTPHHL